MTTESPACVAEHARPRNRKRRHHPYAALPEAASKKPTAQPPSPEGNDFRRRRAIGERLRDEPSPRARLARSAESKDAGDMAIGCRSDGMFGAERVRRGGVGNLSNFKSLSTRDHCFLPTTEAARTPKRPRNQR